MVNMRHAAHAGQSAALHVPQRHPAATSGCVVQEGPGIPYKDHAETVVRSSLAKRNSPMCVRQQAEAAGRFRLLRGDRNEELGVASVDMCFGVRSGS